MTSIRNRFLDVDPYMKNAYSPNDSMTDISVTEAAVKFDIGHKNGPFLKELDNKLKEDLADDEIALKTPRPKEWELDVRALISSRRWLQNYGLKKNRLALGQLLPTVGFKLSDEYDTCLKRPVSSRYGGGLFRQMMHPDGRTFNVNCPKDKLLLLEKRLYQAMNLFKRRLEWLTTESRRVFGVIEERSVTIVLDIRNMSPQQFDQYRTALERVLREQISQLAKFNLIRASEDIQLYSPECVPVSHDTLETAIHWLWKLDRLATVSNTAASEAIFKAACDQHNEAIYLFTEGTSIESGKEILKEKISSLKMKAPVHVVSFNCDCSNTIKYLKDFAKSTRGKFHAYAVVMELDAYEAQPGDGVSRSANIMLKRKTFGGIPPGAGVREDVVLLFEEMEDARNNLAQIKMLIEKAPEPGATTKGKENEPSRAVSVKSEEYMGSQEWLEIYGLEAKRLGLYDVLSGVAFKHQDGVIDIMRQPHTDEQTDAIVQQKLVNARYCERFPVVRWKDGRVVHVQVTPEVHRGYKEKVQVALSKVHQRIDWLNKGSRALFGTVVEDQIYILIDMSASMQPSIGFVKQRIFVLMQEQLRHKRKFNFVAFNSKASAWKDRLVEVSERSLQNAWSWIQNLTCWGSTNTYGAIQLAMSDPSTQAIYLLTDGRPDQPPKSIIAQVQMQKSIPIHTISFNCQDRQANEFLYDLGAATGGRYHYYSDEGPVVDQPEAWESVDIKLLKDEIKRGLENLDRLAGLRDECTSMAWKREADDLRRSINSSRDEKRQQRSDGDFRDGRRQLPARPASAQSRPSSAPPPLALGDAHSPRHTPTPPRTESPTFGSPRMHQRSRSVRGSISRKPLIASHTRTSLMRTLNSSGRFSPNEWLLPETKKLFQLQAERQKNLAEQGEKQEKIRSKRKKGLVKANKMSSKQWLSKYGLAAKKLTILDALGSTFVPHKAKYVSILDKHVMSKVFDDVLPIAHVTRDQQVNLVNPHGVNLKDYEAKVKVMVTKYKKRLNKIVWEALPESAKEEFDSTVPVSYEENRVKIRNFLNEAEWPVKETDIKLLLDEIARAEKFLRQSDSLRKAAAGEADEEDDDDEDGSVVPPQSGSRSQRSNKSHDSQSFDSPMKIAISEQEEEKDDNMSEKSARSDGSKRSDRSRSMSESSIKSEVVSEKSFRQEERDPLPVTDNRDQDHEGLGQVIKTVDKSSQGKVKESSEVIRRKVRIKLDTLKGQKVVARLDGDGLYYPAAVLKCSDPRHALVRYDSGQEAEVLTRNVIPTGGAVARPKLLVGDYVLMRVVNLDSNDECYVPAIVQVGPQNREAQARFYTVLMYNGQKASTLRTYILKISKERFELASMYIAEQQNENRKEVEDLVYVTPRSKKTKTRSKVSKTSEKQRRESSRKEISDEEDQSDDVRDNSSKENQRKNRDKRSRKGRQTQQMKVKRGKERAKKRVYISSSDDSESEVKEEIVSEREENEEKREDELFVKRASKEDVPSFSDMGGDSDEDAAKIRSSRSSDDRSDHSGDRSDRSGDRSNRTGDRSDRSGDRSNRTGDKSNRSGERSKRSDDDSDDVTARQERSESRGDQSYVEGEESHRSDISVNSKRKELDKLQRELQEREERQERQKKKLKRKAKKLARKENDLKGSALSDVEEQEDAMGVPVANDATGGIEDDSNMYKLLELRKTLQHLRPGEEVLARWSDDGWYYRGMVKHYHGDYSYNLEDSTGFVERIWREDIISENDNVHKVIELDKKVVALHPDFSFSYAPATVIDINDNEISVRFYDDREAALPWNEVYHSTNEKYDIDVGYIVKQERRLLGASVVARDDKTGVYYPGCVTRRADNGMDYVIGWTDGTTCVQKSIHIFSAFTRRPPLSSGDRVLALADPVHVKFLPGYITGSVNDDLVVKFCDGEICEGVDASLCYWLGQRFHDDAVKYYKTHDPSVYRIV